MINYEQNQNQYFCSYLIGIGNNIGQSKFKHALNYLPRYNHDGRLYETDGIKILVFPPDSNPLHRLFIVRNGSKVLFLQGDFYSKVDDEYISQIIKNRRVDNAQLASFLNELNGVFNGFVTDLTENSCAAFMNELGFNFLYHRVDEDVIWLSSSIWPLLRISNENINISTTSIQDYILYGYPTGNRTILSNLFMVQPRKISYINKSGVVTSDYAPKYTRKEISTAEALNLFWSASSDHFDYIKNYFSNDQFVATLTGGHDTRVVLNALLKSKISPTCLTGTGWPKKITPDAQRAKYVARFANCRWKMFDYTQRSQHWRSDFFFMNEGGEGGQWMGSTGVEAKKYGDILYYGFSGDVLSGDCGIDHINSLSDIDSITYKTFLQNYEYVTSPQTIISALFRTSFEEVLSQYAKTFVEYKDLDPYSIYLLQRIDNRNFRRIGCFANASRIGSVAVSLFHDKRIAKAYLELPWRLVKNQKFQCILGYSAMPLLSLIPANGWYIPLWAEPILLPGIRKVGKTVINWAKKKKMMNSTNHSEYLISRINKTIDLCIESGIFEVNAIKSIMNTEKQGAIILFLKRIEKVIKLVQFAKGQPIQEEEDTLLFSSDLSKVNRCELKDSNHLIN